MSHDRLLGKKINKKLGDSHSHRFESSADYDWEADQTIGYTCFIDIVVFVNKLRDVTRILPDERLSENYFDKTLCDGRIFDYAMYGKSAVGYFEKTTTRFVKAVNVE